MRPAFQHFAWPALLIGGLVLLPLVPATAADGPAKPKVKAKAKTSRSAKLPTEAQIPAVNLLTALRNGEISVHAEGIGDGRMTVSITNLSHRQLRVVLPPGLIASGATGQFGGMGGGGMGGMGGGMMGGGGMGGMGGMGGGMGGMGGGGMGGMGGGGMGGMGGGGMGGGMGGGGGGASTMPPMMGLMMLGRLIMMLAGERDSWDMSSLMMGMMGGGMGGGMGGMMGGGGMGGMGGMGGGGMGMMGGMRSVPPTSLPFATLRPGQTRHLPTRLVSLSGPTEDSRVNLPSKGEELELGDIAQATENDVIQSALRRLAADKAPESVAQLVMWKLVAGLDWETIARLSGKWANPSELALARQFVDRLGASGGKLPANDSGTLYLEIKTKAEGLDRLADELRKLFKERVVVGLASQEGIPDQPEGPALACRIGLSGTAAAPEAIVEVAATNEAGRAWSNSGKFNLALTRGADGQLKAETVADAVAEGLLSRVVQARLIKDAKLKDKKGHEIYRIRIENASPLILNGIALAGLEPRSAEKPSMLAGIALSPRKSLTLPATADAVERLGLKKGVRVTAAHLGGL